MTELESEKPNHFYFIDFFRGVAAITVVLGHYQHFFYHKGHFSKVDLNLQPFYTSLHFFYQNAGLAVKLFWVISGFVFAAAYLTSELPSAKSFFLKRFARLYPLHFMTLCLVAVLQLISVIITKHFQIYQFNDPYHFMLNIGMVSNWGFQKGYSFNAPIWSVSVEVFVYILFFCSLWLLKRAPVLISLIFAAGFNFLVEKGSFLYPFKYCTVYFFLGVMVFVGHQYFKKWNFMTLIFAASIFISTCVFRMLNTSMVFDLYSLFVLLPSLVLLLSSLDKMDKYNIGKKINILGDLSFSIYLIHIPLEITIMIITEYLGIGKNLFSSEFFFIGYLASIIGISYITFFYYELPMRNFFRQKFSS